MPLHVYKTQRGFPFVRIEDYYEKPCKIQVSSLAGPECIWLGDNHLTRAQVAALVPYLNAFVEHGYNFLDAPIADHPMLSELVAAERD